MEIPIILTFVDNRREHLDHGGIKSFCATVAVYRRFRSKIADRRRKKAISDEHSA